MDTATRIQNIKDYQVKKQIMENAKQLAYEEHYNQLTQDIEALWPRAKEMIDVYNACVKSGVVEFPMEYILGTRNNKFLARKRDGFLGFSQLGLQNNSPYVNAVGMYSFGSYKIDLSNGYLYIDGGKRDIVSHLERFVKEFNTLETEFYSWFDNYILSDPQ